MSKISKISYFLISCIFFVIFDTYFSNIVLENLQNLPENSLIDLIYVQNTGAAFSILQNSETFLIAFSILAILGIFIYLIKNINKVSVISIFWVAMLSAGIFCNTCERIEYGFVRDFFKLNFIDFPVFNISDIFINISVFAIVIIIIKNEIISRRINRRKKN